MRLDARAGKSAPRNDDRCSLPQASIALTARPGAYQRQVWRALCFFFFFFLQFFSHLGSKATSSNIQLSNCPPFRRGPLQSVRPLGADEHGEARINDTSVMQFDQETIPGQKNRVGMAGSRGAGASGEDETRRDKSKGRMASWGSKEEKKKKKGEDRKKGENDQGHMSLAQPAMCKPTQRPSACFIICLSACCVTTTAHQRPTMKCWCWPPKSLGPLHAVPQAFGSRAEASQKPPCCLFVFSPLLAFLP